MADNFPKADGEPPQPLVFLKDAKGAYGDGDVVHLPDGRDRYWGEPELGIVIAKRGYRVLRDAAPAYIERYVIANDVTRENIAGHDHHLMYSKAFPGSLVMGRAAGPEFVVATAAIRGFHNGVLLREGRLGARYFDEASLIGWISSWFVLEPGDIILTGAPARVRDRMYLREGDEFVCEIDGIGRLTNRFSFLGGP